MIEKCGRGNLPQTKEKQMICLYPRVLVMVFFVAFIICACEQKKPTIEPFVATVNGEKIPLSVFEDKLKKYMGLSRAITPVNEDEFKRINTAVLNALIVERLLLQRARELLISVSDRELHEAVEELKKGHTEEEARRYLPQLNDPNWLEEMRKRLIIEKLVQTEVWSKVVVTEGEALDYFHRNRQAYTKKRSVRAAQIVVREKEKAEEIRKRLLRGDDFAALAREVSISPDAVRGGDLGFFAEGEMPEAFDRVAFSLPVGKISPVFQSPYGYHILKVLQKEEGGERTFPELRDRVYSDMKREKGEELYARWIEGLKARAIVIVNKEFH